MTSENCRKLNIDAHEQRHTWICMLNFWLSSGYSDCALSIQQKLLDLQSLKYVLFIFTKFANAFCRK